MAMFKVPSFHSRSRVFLWWRDLCSVSCNVDPDLPSNWFNSSISCKLGMRMFLEFWLDVWLGTSLLGILFPNLFLLTDAPHSKPLLSTTDSFVWWRNVSRFSVSHAYDAILFREIPTLPLDELLFLDFSRLWKFKSLLFHSLPSLFLINSTLIRVQKTHMNELMKRLKLIHQ
ncbi:unnamed protein product [Vicia faba]|uniref:Uncharacterized protein n=1 Tax=Vicia faba TaxID=3906 RepID=A0AAV1AIN9_VICFA|nr:unnamed protein product [Vicia faba]